MLDINKIKEELISQFPEYSFFVSRRLNGRCIVAKKTKYRGADIFVKKDRIVIDAAIPEWKTRFILGAGAAYIRLTKKDFFEVALQIRDFLGHRYDVSIRR